MVEIIEKTQVLLSIASAFFEKIAYCSNKSKFGSIFRTILRIVSKNFTKIKSLFPKLYFNLIYIFILPIKDIYTIKRYYFTFSRLLILNSLIKK